jgi:peptidylprolyl isomerase
MSIFPRADVAVFLLAVGLNSVCCAQQTWRAIDAENALVIDTTKGRLIVEMRPDMASKSVERLKMLARKKIYNGLQFHRVIANFVAQTGNPNNKDGGKTSYPNLPPETTFKTPRNAIETWASNASDAGSGFFGSVPVQAAPLRSDRQAVRVWGAHCAGVMGMGRDAPLDSANSEFYFMLAPGRDLDHEYSVVGRVVVGMDVLAALKVGEPPANPDIMQSVRVLADLPAAERRKVSILTGPALGALIDKVRREKSADFSICDVAVPVKVE